MNGQQAQAYLDRSVAVVCDTQPDALSSLIYADPFLFDINESWRVLGQVLGWIKDWEEIV